MENISFEFTKRQSVVKKNYHKPKILISKKVEVYAVKLFLRS